MSKETKMVKFTQECTFEVEKKVVGIVSYINSYPGLITIASCGGHKHPRYPDQIGKKGFYVHFIPRADNGWPSCEALDSLVWLTRYVEEMRELSEVGQYLSIECRTIQGQFVFILTGTGMTQEDFFELEEEVALDRQGHYEDLIKDLQDR
jgi:hypothetical protein